MNKTLLITLCLTLVPAMAHARDQDSALERVLKEELRDEVDHKGKGRPDNPGEHGRDNAAQKQSENHGKNKNKNKSGYSLEDALDSDKDKKDKKDKKH